MIKYELICFNYEKFKLESINIIAKNEENANKIYDEKYKENNRLIAIINKGEQYE